MKPHLTTIATLCREVALPASVLVWLVAFGSGAAPIIVGVVPSLTADASFVDKQPIAAHTADVVIASRPVTEPVVSDAMPASQSSLADKTQPIAVVTADVAIASKPTAEPNVADATPAAQNPEPIVTAALSDSSETLSSETPSEPVAETNTATPQPGEASRSVDSTAGLGECLAIDPCIDRYLWTLYQRTPKEDAVKIQEQRKVSVRKKGKLVSVTRTFTKLTDEDFAWKDPKAADHAGMSMADYVIGGMDRDFKLRLFHMLHVAEEAGLSPGITSAFRDDYRQSIASGLKAADNRSYHGGSLRGGYGHGLAADIVSVNGATRADRLASSETLWKWVDQHGKEFGIGRPYLGRDPPHVAPIDGKEYADHFPKMKARQARAAAKPHHGLASRDDRTASKRARTAGSSRVRTI